MRPNKLKQTIAAGGRILNGWCSIGNSYAAEVYAHQGFDSVTVDMQHGVVDYTSAIPMLQAISTTDAVPMARVPWNEPGIIMKMLDAGAYGIVCPMINSKTEAEAFVGAARYAPAGFRSFGPNRAVQYGGADYWQHANREVLLFAMIETRAALDNLDDILSVPGLDGTYIGPSDLSLSLGRTPTLAPDDPEVLAAMETIRRKTQARGLIAGVHTDGAKTALKCYARGFQLCTLLNDVRLMAAAASAAVKEVRGEAQGPAAKTY